MSSNAGDQTGRETAVLIHGLSDSRAVWWRQQDGLSADMDVVAYDVRGFGTSPAGGGLGTVAQLADDLAQIVSAQVAGPAWLIGFSMGGVIAQQFALDFPQLTRGLVLIGSSCTIGRARYRVFRQTHRRSQWWWPRFARANQRWRCTRVPGQRRPRTARRIPSHPKPRRSATKAGYLNACYAMRALSDNKLTEQLPNIDCPALGHCPRALTRIVRRKRRR